MPTLSVEKDQLFLSLGRNYTDEEFGVLCFDFGIELDEITSEREEALKCSTTKLKNDHIFSLSDRVIYKIDVPANRYDLLCREGLSRALKVFLGDMDSPTYKFEFPSSGMLQTMYVKPGTAQIRPYIVCAVLRNIKFNEERYHSFIDLQDQLHRNLCRQRTLVAIGTHDMDSITGPFTYDTYEGDCIEFVPLTHSATGESFTACTLLQCYETDPLYKHLKPYVSIIKDSHFYPVVLDSNKTVMSLPPVINGSKSKITLHTENILIECTATDLTKANIVLDTIVAMFSEYCSKPFSVEPVQVNFMGGENCDVVTQSYVTPIMSTRTEIVPVDYCNSVIGIDIKAESMVDLCNKMQLGPAEVLEDNKTSMLKVFIPPTRSDILHHVDIAEDVGIAYGYNNITMKTPKTSFVGKEQPLQALSDSLREEIARAGYTEILTHGLSSTYDNFSALRKKPSSAVILSNPANIEFDMIRTSLLPGLLKTLQHNKSASFSSGFRIFEISDVVLLDNEHIVTETIVGAKNIRRICALYAGPTSGFEIIHGLVDRIMVLCEVTPEEDYIKISARRHESRYTIGKEGWSYTISELKEDCHYNWGVFFPQRSAEVLLTSPNAVDKISIGTFGVVHPEILYKFDIKYPCSCMEIDIEALA